MVLPDTEGGTLVDAGFENGADGATLASPPWTAISSPTNREYDNGGVITPKVGSGCAYILPVNEASYDGVLENASTGMAANGSEIRFWVYRDSTNKIWRVYDNIAAGATYGTFYLYFPANGDIQIGTSKTSPPTGYTTGNTTVGTQSIGWTQYRFIFDFTNQQYTLSTRSTRFGTWTPLKAASAVNYNIPMRGGSTVVSTGGLAFAGQSAAIIGIDEIRYSSGGIAEYIANPIGVLTCNTKLW
jgi:hypothetical protein